MASGTITGSTGNQYIDSKIEWSSVANNSANSSEVTAALYYRRNNTGFKTTGTGTFSITIGDKKTSATKSLTISTAWVKAVEATETISHRSDGSKSITISASGSIPSTTLTSTSCSDTVELDTIPRASSITSASDTTLGNNCSVKWTPLASSFTYRLKFALEEWSLATPLISPKTTKAYTFSFPIPLVVANQLPNSKTGTMVVTLATFSDKFGLNLVGKSSKTFTVTVPNNTDTKPSVSMNISPVSSLGDTFSSLYIQGKTQVKATISGEGNCGADIKSYRLYVGAKNYGSPYQSDYLSTSGSVLVRGRAMDSRGYYNIDSQYITVIPYSKPTILPASNESNIICGRCDSDGNLSESGTDLKIRARRSYSKVEVDGTQKNFCTLRYRYREESTNTFSPWKTLIENTSTATDTVDVKLSDVVSDIQTSYIVQIGVVDDIGETDAVQYIIPTGFTTLDIPESHKGRRIGMFRYVDDTPEDGLYMGLPIFGGSIDSLKLGTRLTATSTTPLDLNDIKTPGCYYSPGADYSKYIANTPYTTGGFGLEVRELQSMNYIRQTLYYGRTTLIRHWNTTEWSDWLRYMVTTEGESTAVDFVTDTGVSYIDSSDTNKGYWRYRKWKSGAVDMSGFIKVTPTTEGTLGTAGVYYSQTIYIDLPFSVSNFQFTGSGAAYHIFVGNTNSVDGNDKQIRLRLYRFTDFAGLSDYDVYIRIVANGRYT